MRQTGWPEVFFYVHGNWERELIKVWSVLNFLANVDCISIVWRQIFFLDHVVNTLDFFGLVRWVEIPRMGVRTPLEFGSSIGFIVGLYCCANVQGTQWIEKSGIICVRQLELVLRISYDPLNAQMF